MRKLVRSRCSYSRSRRTRKPRGRNSRGRVPVYKHWRPSSTDNVEVFIAIIRAAFGAVLSAIAPALTATSASASCIEQISVPTYPTLARQSGLSGELITSVRLDSGSKVGEVSYELLSGPAKARNLLAPAVEHSVRSAVFARECAGKTLSLIFRFVIDNRPRVDCPIPIASFRVSQPIHSFRATRRHERSLISNVPRQHV